MAKTTIVSRASRCQPNLAPHFNSYRNNTRILPLCRRSPGGMLVTDSSSRDALSAPGASLPLFIHFALYEQLRNAVCVIARKNVAQTCLRHHSQESCIHFLKHAPDLELGLNYSGLGLHKHAPDLELALNQSGLGSLGG
jgi:hypothetical protein